MATQNGLEVKGERWRERKGKISLFGNKIKRISTLVIFTKNRRPCEESENFLGENKFFRENSNFSAFFGEKFGENAPPPNPVT